MERRDFLKVAGVMAAGSAVTVGATTAGRATTVMSTPDAPATEAVAAADGAPLQIPAPGTYKLVGRVRMEAPVVEIGGITNAKTISRSPREGTRPVVEFTSVDYFPAPGLAAGITVQGGVLESLTATRFDVG